MKVAIGMQSLRHKLLQGEMSTIDFLKLASRLYVKGVEIAQVFLPRSEGELLAVRDKLRTAGLGIPSLFVHQSGLTEGIKQARELGAGCVTLTPEGDVEAVYQSVRAVLPEIEDAGLVFALENSTRSKFTCRALSELVEEIAHPKVQFSFNVADCFVVGEDPLKVIDQLQGYLAHVRINDLRPEFEQKENSPLVGAVLGLGLLPVRPLLEKLLGQEYQGWLTVEFSGGENVFFGIEASLKNLHQLLHEIAHKGIAAPGEMWP